MIPLLLCLSSLLAPSPATEVARVSLEDLVRVSDLVVVGRVVRIRELARNRKGWTGSEVEWELQHLTELPIAEVEVSSVLKGPPETKRALYMAAGTWTCDITEAVPGETALFFLQRGGFLDNEGDEVRGEFDRTFGHRELLELAWSGRGRMPFRSVDGRDYVTYWTDIVMPKDLPNIDGPEAKHASFIRSAPLEDLRRCIQESVEAQKKPFLEVSVAHPGSGRVPWDLTIAGDRACRLLVHEPGGDRERRFVLPPGGWWSLTDRMDFEAILEGRVSIGRRSGGSPDRSLTLHDGDRTKVVRLLAVDEAWMTDPRKAGQAVRILDLWRRACATFDDEACSKFTEDADRWVPRQR